MYKTPEVVLNEKQSVYYVLAHTTIKYNSPGHLEAFLNCKDYKKEPPEFCLSQKEVSELLIAAIKINQNRGMQSYELIRVLLKYGADIYCRPEGENKRMVIEYSNKNTKEFILAYKKKLELLN